MATITRTINSLLQANSRGNQGQVAIEPCLNDNRQVHMNNRGDRGWVTTLGPCKLLVK